MRVLVQLRSYTTALYMKSLPARRFSASMTRRCSATAHEPSSWMWGSLISAAGIGPQPPGIAATVETTAAMARKRKVVLIAGVVVMDWIVVIC
ncbi:hypothetical protein EJB05_07587 [Eragrostis curvula]|uniref:Uncharacterized protein n=1 Tax=Eragrostis curvula TaxID=38414 RepID=A0A5J9WI57_9POAL|nr:hypothetical protein EJB05_07587 [Eragrostis curvula]